MNFLVPHSVTEQLICNLCYKFLSVTPVKIFPSRKICGRCSESQDGGVISLYNTIIEKTIFPCVNRRDGCRELLSTADVLKHENVCKPKAYTCPICYKYIATFFMLKHFETYHENNIFKSSHFNWKLGVEKEVFFLYQSDGNLFFLGLKLDSKTSTILCSYLGNFKHCKFIFEVRTSQSNNMFVTYETVCPEYPSFKSIKLNLPQKQSAVSVKVVDVNLESKCQTLIGLPQRNAIPQQQEITDEEEKVMYSLGLKLVAIYFQERDIITSDAFQKVFADVSIIQGCTIKCKVSNKNICVTLSCSLCSQIFYSTIDSVYFFYLNDRYHFACWSCSKYLNKPIEKLFSTQNLNEISFFCQWDCGKFFPLTTLKQHEETCEIQLPQRCPVSFCNNYFKIFEIKAHFKNKHADLITPIFIDLFGREVQLDLDPHVSPIKRYFLIATAYIYIEFVWKKPLWNISLSCKLPHVKPRALIFSHDGVFTDLIKKKGSIRHMNKLYIKCYLAHPEREY